MKGGPGRENSPCKGLEVTGVESEFFGASWLLAVLSRMG